MSAGHGAHQNVNPAKCKETAKIRVASNEFGCFAYREHKSSNGSANSEIRGTEHETTRLTRHAIEYGETHIHLRATSEAH
jgi:hypothetical protein